MLLIWRGWGILAIVIPVLFIILSQLGIDYIYGDNFYKNHSSIIAPLALVLSSPLIYYIGNKLNHKTERKLLDPKTNEEVVLKSSNDLFWIPLQYWGFIIATISLYMYLHEKAYI